VTVRRKVYKTSINLSLDAVEALERIAGARGESVAAVIRKAISTEVFFEKAVAEGGTILIDGKHGTLRRLVFP
jgi:predicted transcriptional regulator